MAQKQLVKHDPNTIAALFEDPKVKMKLLKAVPKHLDGDRLLRIAITAIKNNPQLLQCTQRSLLASVMGCAVLGLEPEPTLGQAYLVPFKNKWGQTEAKLIPGYRGYIALARRSGEVQTIQCQAVYTEDNFKLQFGLNPQCDLIPAEGDRGEFKGAFVIFNYKDGSYSYDYMSKADIDGIRNRSKAKNSGPWVTDYDEMAKKTVIRRHVKLTPLTVEMAKAAQAENMALGGESQIDFFPLEANGEEGTIDIPGTVEEFDERVRVEADGNEAMVVNVNAYVEQVAKNMQAEPDEVKKMAVNNWETFWKSYTDRPKNVPHPDSRPHEVPKKITEKKASEMNTEELTIYRLKKASAKTIEGVVKRNWDNIQASQAALDEARAKWERLLDTPFPSVPAPGPSMTQEEADEETAKILEAAARQYGGEVVTEAAISLGYDGKPVNLDMAETIAEKAMEIYAGQHM
jgi:recombination protein RecT